MSRTNRIIAETMTDVFGLSPMPLAPRQLDVFLNRAELARAADAPTARVYRAFADGALTADALDASGHPLFFAIRLPQLRAALDKNNTPKL